jgi:hypothetical protein
MHIGGLGVAGGLLSKFQPGLRHVEKDKFSGGI